MTEQLVGWAWVLVTDAGCMVGGGMGSFRPTTRSGELMRSRTSWLSDLGQPAELQLSILLVRFGEGCNAYTCTRKCSNETFSSNSYVLFQVINQRDFISKTITIIFCVHSIVLLQRLHILSPSAIGSNPKSCTRRLLQINTIK